jgi:hypothetical protein
MSVLVQQGTQDDRNLALRHRRRVPSVLSGLQSHRAAGYDLCVAVRCPKCRSRGFKSGDVPCPDCGWQDPILEPWVPSAWYPDPANPGKMRYYSKADRQWQGKSMSGAGTRPIPTEPPKLPERELGPPRIAVLDDCSVLGGHGLGFQREARVTLAFNQSGITIRLVSTPRTSGQETQVGQFVPYSDVEVIEIGGPGRTTRGGGFYGGGFGLGGAAEGMMIAAALNLLSTRKRTDTVVCLRTHAAELFLHHRRQPPDQLRMALSEVFTILRALQETNGRQLTSIRDDRVLDGLTKLGDLLEQGVITPEEFATLKGRLISS